MQYSKEEQGKQERLVAREQKYYHIHLKEQKAKLKTGSPWPSCEDVRFLKKTKFCEKLQVHNDTQKNTQYEIC